jgi:hypothetical protein
VKGPLVPVAVTVAEPLQPEQPLVGTAEVVAVSTVVHWRKSTNTPES